MRLPAFLLHSILGAVVAVPAAGADLPPTSAVAVRARAAFLASDALEGRFTGSRGHEIAAQFAAAELAGWGLEPGGQDGSYFQYVPLVKSSIEQPRLAVAHGSRKKSLASDEFLLAARPASDDVSATLPVVLVGYGIDAPSLGHRDWDGVDVRGKAVLVLSGAPSAFPTEERAHYSSRRLKAEEAARRGAAGLLMLRTREDSQRTPWARLVQYAAHPTMYWIQPDGQIQDAFPELRFTGAVGETAAAKLLEGSGSTLDALLDAAERDEVRSRPLATRVSVSARYVHERVRSPNVIAVLPGSDPALAGEHVLITAHLDHVGIGREVDGDKVYNGFYDNALGSSIVMELAHALSRLEPGPRRSIDFALVTGEEEGLLGSDYLAHHPTPQGETVVADVNIDMPLLLHPVADLIALGAEHSSLGPLAATAAAAHRFTLSPDPHPEEVYFVRSDQYSFVRAGVPSINLDTGEKSLDPSIDGKALDEQFRKTHYHRPSDEASLPLDLEALARYMRVNLDLVAAVADADVRPHWNEGDFFGALYGGSGTGAAP